MARIEGVNLPSKKRIEIGLTYIFGIGRSRSNKILEKAKIDKNKKVEELTSKETDKIKKIVEEYKTEGALKREVAANIKRLKDIKCYRGSRHKRNLPARGQQTQTNSRTVRGNARRTLATGKRSGPKTP
ncbi:MAG TPA: 30S ribosomal protein S13 [Patescibacteria group bacterium]|nr:30S ribosomal protein S13 [Patescibacteria group bacterium]